ncbi:uncharacterized protein TNCV_3763891 [Trichonephila clavipes]|uniref:Uncharacterized protein n=1 Tax=Trichonephila clavipes TaxID=2585209 RepID=A0A8X7B9L3_TRICX|nr:uncharacterized protein TNCV_3763891 [Trichonephila clavipes]
MAAGNTLLNILYSLAALSTNQKPSTDVTEDQDITSNKHIEGQVIEARKKRLNVLKFISGRDWVVEASTLRTTFISFLRPVMGFGIPSYSCASDTNLNKLERVQLCAARIITVLRYSCQIDIVLIESNLPSLSKRRLYSLTTVFLKVWGVPPGGAMTLQGGREHIENFKILKK